MGFGFLFLLAVCIGISYWARLQGMKRVPAEDAKLAGVCGGIAAHFQINALAARGLWIVATLVSAGLSIVLYLCMWMILPVGRNNTFIGD